MRLWPTPWPGRGCCWDRILHAKPACRKSWIRCLPGGCPTLEDVPRLEYTVMVLSESMRLYPPAWAMGRQALEDVSIGPYRLRKGTMVFFSQYIVQRDPRWFPHP